MDILNARADGAGDRERSEADFLVWREAVRFQARSAICEAAMHPLAPVDPRRAPVLVALDAISLAMLGASLGDPKWHRSAEDLAHLVAARDLLELVGE